MSIEASNWAWTVPVKGMEKLVLLRLADMANAKGECWPAIDTLQTYTGAGERTVRACIGTLAERGFLHRETRTNRSSLYRLRFDAKFDPVGPAAQSKEIPPELPEVAETAPVQISHPCNFCQEEVQILPEEVQNLPVAGAESAPKPSKNHQLTIKEPSISTRCTEAGEEIEDVSFAEVEIIPPDAVRATPLLSDLLSQAPVTPRSVRKRSRKANGEPEGFGEWFPEYPRQDGRIEAAKAYAAAIKAGATQAELLEGLRRTRWPANPQYIKEAKNWLKNERWKDRGVVDGYPVEEGESTTGWQARRLSELMAERG
jgi:Helix-turn-helix domain